MGKHTSIVLLHFKCLSLFYYHTGTQEYTPLTEQAEETVEKNLFRVKGHNFRLYTFKQPTYCALCRKFLW